VTRVWRRRRRPPVTTVREAISVLGEASDAELAAALAPRDGHDADEDTPLREALGLLHRWFDDLPPDRTEPSMSFPEFARLLHQALRHP
jgi:hypothetical protein